MILGQVITTPIGPSTVLADIDFETYSEAGYVRASDAKKPGGFKWVSATGNANTAGLSGVGAPKYSEHPSTEILWLSYDLKDGSGPKLWEKSQSYDILSPLFEYIRSGGVLAAWNSAFEYWIWENVGHKRLGWPRLPRRQLRDDAAKACASGLPSNLDTAAQVIAPDTPKDPRGKQLIKLFSMPRTPTKKDPLERFTIYEKPAEWYGFGAYCKQDIVSEAAISARIPDLSPFELNVWLADQDINERGVAIDLESVANCIKVIEQATVKYNQELQRITGGRVREATKLQQIQGWLADNGVYMPDMQAETIEETLDQWEVAYGDGLHVQKRVLEIRALLGSASVKKLYAIARRVTNNGRLHDLFKYHGPHTGRWAGMGPQPQNLPAKGPTLQQCEQCEHHYGIHLEKCPWCGCDAAFSKTKGWGPGHVDDVLAVINHNKGNLEIVEHCFGEAVPAVVGCLRGLFVASENKELICSDYNAIEAVVLACLAREQWRIDVFNTHGMIYEMSASKITGVPFDDFIKHKQETGEHHPLRKTIGKVAELGSGYQGSVGAWKNFGADEFFNSDEEILEKVREWRKASPNIVKFWYGLENAAKSAIKYPGQCFRYNDIRYQFSSGNLYCLLPSGRILTYNGAFLQPHVRYNKPAEKICFWAVDSKTKQWTLHDTYGGKLTENVVQAVARDILAFAILNLEKAGYPVVLHVHDEIVSEITKTFGSIEEFEAIMMQLPHWCSWWPIRASGGWRGFRFRKD